MLRTIALLLLWLVSQADSFWFFPSSSKKFNITDSREILVHVKVKDLFVSDVSNLTDVVRLRQTLKRLYPLELYDSHVELNIEGFELSLMHSTMPLPGDFHVKVRKNNSADDSVLKHNSSDFTNQPFCLMQTTDVSVSGIFNLCNGINGFISNGTHRIDVRSHMNASLLTHFCKETTFSKDRGRIPKEIKDSFKKLKNERRKKRTVVGARAYLELYIIAEYDFYDEECANDGITSKEGCVDVVWEFLYPVSVVYRYAFDIFIVPVGIEIWTEGNLADIPIYKQSSTEYKVNGYLTTINTWADDNVKLHTRYDAVLYLTTTVYIWSDIRGLAQNDGLCLYRPVAYVDTYSGRSNEKPTLVIVHELGHLFGADHIETKACKCGDNGCFMADGE